ncbi:MAG: hypothetical protein NVSMB9_29060 [Isosphaeraceae bacterium]
MRNRANLKIAGRASVGLLFTLILSGCVERRYTIRTEPPGALVIVNNEEIGRTPVSRSFTFYGNRDITLMLDGFQTQRIIQPIKAPWYDNYLTEFFTENVVPVTLRDERDFTYRMIPASVPKVDELRTRAENLRLQARSIPAPRRGGILGFFGF